jgi:hypothetical protein
MVEVKILCQMSDRQLSNFNVSNLVQICTFPLRLLLTTENLHIDGILTSPLVWVSYREHQMVESFTFIYSCQESLPIMAIFTTYRARSEPVQKGIARFNSARQLTNHPVAISDWHKDFLWDYM